MRTSPQKGNTMANLTPAAEVFTVTVYLSAIDDYGVIRERLKLFELDPSVTTSLGATTAAEALVADLVVVSKADVLGFTIHSTRKASVGSVTAIANLRAEGLVTLNPADGSEKMPHTIFAPANAIVAGKTLVEDSTILLDYIANFQTAGDFNISDGELVAATNPIASSAFKITGQKYI